MRIKLDPTRPQTADDRRALSLIAEGFRRLRASEETALDGAQSKSSEPDCVDSASVNLGNHESGSQGFDQAK